MATKTLRTFTREEVAKVRTTGGVTVTKVNVSTDAKHPCLLFRVQHNTPDDLVSRPFETGNRTKD